MFVSLLNHKFFLVYSGRYQRIPSHCRCSQSRTTKTDVMTRQPISKLLVRLQISSAEIDYKHHGREYGFKVGEI